MGPTPSSFVRIWGIYPYKHILYNFYVSKYVLALNRKHYVLNRYCDIQLGLYHNHCTTLFVEQPWLLWVSKLNYRNKFKLLSFGFLNLLLK